MWKNESPKRGYGTILGSFLVSFLIKKRIQLYQKHKVRLGLRFVSIWGDLGGGLRTRFGHVLDLGVRTIAIGQKCENGYGVGARRSKMRIEGVHDRIKHLPKLNFERSGFGTKTWAER